MRDDTQYIKEMSTDLGARISSHFQGFLQPQHVVIAIFTGVQLIKISKYLRALEGTLQLTDQ